tara:strand:+ start:5851 stop:6291 length:441 start_codon:yes stop_codon:yes gene_type:complete
VVFLRSVKAAATSIAMHPTVSTSTRTIETETDIAILDDKGYRPGWCGVHVIQYQKPDPSKDQYSLEVTALNDANENKIGEFKKGGPTASVTSKLPLTLEIKTGGVDADPVRFAYGSQSWDSNDKGRCSVGAYDNGKRQMDCGFTCD